MYYFLNTHRAKLGNANKQSCYKNTTMCQILSNEKQQLCLLLLSFNFQWHTGKKENAFDFLYACCLCVIHGTKKNTKKNKKIKIIKKKRDSLRISYGPELGASYKFLGDLLSSATVTMVTMKITLKIMRMTI